MANRVILRPLDGSDRADRILAEFERRTGVGSDRRPDGRYYELPDDEHLTHVVQVLTSIDGHWSEQVGLVDPT